MKGLSGLGRRTGRGKRKKKKHFKIKLLHLVHVTGTERVRKWTKTAWEDFSSHGESSPELVLKSRLLPDDGVLNVTRGMNDKWTTIKIEIQLKLLWGDCAVKLVPGTGTGEPGWMSYWTGMNGLRELLYRIPTVSITSTTRNEVVLYKNQLLLTTCPMVIIKNRRNDCEGNGGAVIKILLHTLNILLRFNA